MPSTVKTILDEACKRSNIPVPSTYVGNGNQTATQMLSLFKETGDYIRGHPFDWPQLKRSFMFTTQTNCRSYPLPGDFYRCLESTPWDSTNQWPMRGPISDYNFAIRTLAIVSLQVRKAFRFLGRANTIYHNRTINEYNTNADAYIEVDPPGQNEITLLQYEYISKNWALPPSWQPNTAYSSATPSYVNVNGIVYKCTQSGTSITTLIPPNVINGVGQDGNSIWLNVITAAWGATTAYSPGDYVSNGGNYYLCTTGGTSAGSGGPTGTNSSITDGTVTWGYVTAAAWAAETSYGLGTYATANSKLYLNLARTSDASFVYSGKTAPAWSYSNSLWIQADASTQWAYQFAAYSILTDNDICLFDDNLMIEGICWMILRARGAQYQDRRQDWDGSIRAEANRLDAPIRVNAADEFGDQFGEFPSTPPGSWGV